MDNGVQFSHEEEQNMLILLKWIDLAINTINKIMFSEK